MYTCHRSDIIDGISEINVLVLLISSMNNCRYCIPPSYNSIILDVTSECRCQLQWRYQRIPHHQHHTLLSDHHPPFLRCAGYCCRCDAYCCLGNVQLTLVVSDTSLDWIIVWRLRKGVVWLISYSWYIGCSGWPSDTV